LQDLNLFVTGLAVAFDRVEHDKRRLAERIKWDTLPDGALLRHQLVFDRLTRVIPASLLFFVLFKKVAALLLKLFFHLFLHCKGVI